MEIPITVDITNDLPNGNYVEGSLAAVGFTVHCSSGTTYGEACELMRAKQDGRRKEEMMNAPKAPAGFGPSINFEYSVVSCEFKGGLVDMGVSAVTGVHTFKLLQVTTTTVGRQP